MKYNVRWTAEVDSEIDAETKEEAVNKAKEICSNIDGIYFDLIGVSEEDDVQ